MSANTFHFSEDDAQLIRTLVRHLTDQLDRLPATLHYTGDEGRLSTDPPLTFDKVPGLTALLGPEGERGAASRQAPTATLWQWTTWKRYFRAAEPAPTLASFVGSTGPSNPAGNSVSSNATKLTDSPADHTLADDVVPLEAVTGTGPRDPAGPNNAVTLAQLPYDAYRTARAFPVCTLQLAHLHTVLAAAQTFRLLDLRDTDDANRAGVDGDELSASASATADEDDPRVHDRAACLACNLPGGTTGALTNGVAWYRLLNLPAPAIGSSGRSAASPVEAELRWLLTFFHYVPALRLVNLPNPNGVLPVAPGPVSLAPFAHLIHLELAAVAVDAVRDWPRLARQLESLRIAQGFDGTPDRLLREGANPAAPADPPWVTLRHLDLGRNAVTTLPMTLTRWLTACVRLSLAHNHLTIVPDTLRTLVALRSLDLSYNRLTVARDLGLVLGQVTHLSLRGNQLTELRGLAKLWALEELDVRDNAIADRDPFLQLVGLPLLKSVWLAGNPYVRHHPHPYVPVFFAFQAKGAAVRLDGRLPDASETKHLRALFDRYDEPEVAASSATHGMLSVNSITGPVAPPALVSHSVGRKGNTKLTAGVTPTRTVRRSVSVSHSGSPPLIASLTGRHSPSVPRASTLNRALSKISHHHHHHQGGRDRVRLAVISDPVDDEPASALSPEIGRPSITQGIAIPGPNSGAVACPPPPRRLNGSEPASTVTSAGGSPVGTLPERRSVLRALEVNRLSGAPGSLWSPPPSLQPDTASPGRLVRSRTASAMTAGRPFSSVFEQESAQMPLNSPSFELTRPSHRPGSPTGSCRSSALSSLRPGTEKYRQRIETMREQAGSTWLKVFREMQTADPKRAASSGMFSEGVTAAGHDDPTASADEGSDIETTPTLPDFLFPTPPLIPPSSPPPPSPSLQRRGSDPDQPPLLPPRATSPATNRPIPMRNEPRTPRISPSTTNSPKVGEPKDPSEAPDSPPPTLYSPGSVLLGATVVAYDLVPAHGKFRRRQPDPARGGALAFTPMTEVADAVPDAELLELDVEHPQHPSVVARHPLSSLITAMVSDESATDLTLYLDFKTASFDVPYRLELRLHVTTGPSDESDRVPPTALGQARARRRVTPAKLAQLTGTVRTWQTANWRAGRPREVCKQARCLRCAWAGSIEPPASLVPPDPLTLSPAVWVANTIVTGPPAVTDDGPPPEPACPQCHSTYLVEFYGGADDTAAAATETMATLAVAKATVPTDGSGTDWASPLIAWASPLSNLTTATAHAVGEIPHLAMSTVGALTHPFGMARSHGSGGPDHPAVSAAIQAPSSQASPPAFTAPENDPSTDKDTGLPPWASALPHTLVHGGSGGRTEAPLRLPFQTATNATRLFLSLDVFSDASERLLMWIPAAYVRQLPPFFTAEVPSAPGTASVTNTGTAPSRWSLLPVSWSSPPAAPYPTTKDAAATTASSDDPAWPAHAPKVGAAERPAFLALSNQRIYLFTFAPAFYRRTGEALRSTPGNVTAHLRTLWARWDHQPGQYLQPAYAIDFATIQRVDVKPHRQALTFHFALPGNAQQAAAGTATASSGDGLAAHHHSATGSASTTAQASQAASTPATHTKGQRPPPSIDPAQGPQAEVDGTVAGSAASVTVLIRDRLACSDFLNAFVVQCYEADVHVVDRRVRAVNHDIEWAIHNLRDTVFLRPGLCIPNAEEGEGGKDRELAKPGNPYLTMDDRARLTQALRAAGTHSWVDPASGDDVVVDKVTFEFLKLYYLVGWLRGPTRRPMDQDGAAPRLVTCACVVTPGFMYLVGDRHDVWPPAIPALTDLYQDKLAQQQVAKMKDEAPIAAEAEAEANDAVGSNQAVTPPDASQFTYTTTRAKRAVRTELLAHRVPQYHPYYAALPVAALRRVTFGRCCIAPGVAAGSDAYLAWLECEGTGMWDPWATAPPLDGVTASGWTHWVTLTFDHGKPETGAETVEGEAHPDDRAIATDTGDGRRGDQATVAAAAAVHPSDPEDEAAGIPGCSETEDEDVNSKPGMTAEMVRPKGVEEKLADPDAETFEWPLLFTTAASASEFVEALHHLEQLSPHVEFVDEILPPSASP
ncbi:hypothetical protein IWQ60_005434 [Tieghemiomyces parasiticus]|uniref:Uncharacterized protein n=1 Tax=Tieghemiomyces parasiticus TaxID=78921 RepID=A0A9W8A6B0_9FUNG|nr:hypothetical protein IWQ60_005434 [Tieghemiomyces parasiticus]